MPIIHIDQQPYEVKAGKNLLDACLGLGLDLPYFCWHPAMGSVGACRQCAVKVFKDENDTRGKLSMACMEPVKDGLFLSVNDPVAKAFRSQVIEWLMLNHPHDCPVCDEGGSCHLQDMTVMTGHNYRRSRFRKRTYTNQYLGPFLNHEMNRCIQCYRCVRFYKDYAGGKDLDVFAAHDHVYFGRAEDGVLESEFSGNLAEVCPTGVFTDKTLKAHYTRKWDLTMAPSVCQHCSVGCNVIGGERYGKLRQISNRYNEEINGYFICDRGRFGYEYVNDSNRVMHPMLKGITQEQLTGETIAQQAAEMLPAGEKIIGIGSPRASLESNFALRQLVGKENFYQGIPEKEAQILRIIVDALQMNKVHTPSLREVEAADCILILGEDLNNTAPRMALSVQQALRKKPAEDAQKIAIPDWNDAATREYVQQERAPLFIAYPVETKLQEYAALSWNLASDDIARLGYSIAAKLSDEPAYASGLDERFAETAETVAGSLQNAKNPLIIAGSGLFNESTVKAAINIGAALRSGDKKASVAFVLPHANSMGLAMTGAPAFPDAADFPENSGGALIILENDIYRLKPKREIDTLLSRFNQVIALDHLLNATAARADFLIPASTFAEGDGTLVNYEGRAQRFFQVFMPANPDIRESWRWLTELRMQRHPLEESKFVLDDLLAALAVDMPQFAGVQAAAPTDDFRISGERIPREPHRYSGRTAILANTNVSEPKPPEDVDSPLSFTMEGYKGIPPAPLTPFFWAPGWNSNQAVNKYQSEIAGPLKGDNPGKRLYPEREGLQFQFLNPIPEPFVPRDGERLLVPLPHLFGSEELSLYTNGILQRTPAVYVALNESDAAVLDVSEGADVYLTIGEERFVLPATIRKELPAGCAGIPYQVPPLTGIAWPASGRINKQGA